MLKIADDEVIIKTFRKHWFVPLIRSILASILFVIPIIVLLYFLNHTVSTDFFEFTFALREPAIAVFVIAMWGLFLWLRFFSFWSDHHLDGWVLTNKRVIDLDQRGYFRREISSFRLERLQDVTTEIGGILGTFFKFGKVRVQTAGTDREFVLKDATDPNKVKETIMAEHDRTIESEQYHDKDSVGSTK